ncbi:MarR family winged helix-turn-helix transcriptional regulator [Alphaproteobacteria bacterium]|nr:MarR family winged helix-turn-helix transcriptional regulator [Alphaproteobacteria bacterium]
MNDISCMCISIRKAANHISKVYDHELSVLDIKITQYSALKNILALGNPSVNELSKKLDLERTTVLRNLDKLRKMDLISYKKNDLYKVKVISLTVNGRKKLNDAKVIWEKTQQKLLNAFGLNNKNQFDSLMNKISKLNF